MAASAAFFVFWAPAAMYCCAITRNKPTSSSRRTRSLFSPKILGNDSMKRWRSSMMYAPSMLRVVHRSSVTTLSLAMRRIHSWGVSRTWVFCISTWIGISSMT